jgi:hypothetical protein
MTTDSSEKALGDVELSVDVQHGSASFSARGSGSLVLKAFKEFRDFLATTEELSTGRSSQELQVPADPSPPTPEKATSGSVPLSVFLDQHKMPRGNAIVALGIAVWAKRYKSEDEITADIAKGHWRNSKRKVPANINRDLGVAASEGWLERLPSGQGKYAVTSYGEAHFDGLPKGDS